MIYEGNGAPTKYETVPGYANCILLPNFTGGSGGSGEGGEPVDPGEGINVTINISIPSGWSMSTIRDAGAVIFVYAFEGEYSAPTWLSTTGEGNTVNVTFDKAPGQFIVVRCAAGTTTGNWDAKWNQTGNITYRASGTSYSAELQ